MTESGWERGDDGNLDQRGYALFRQSDLIHSIGHTPRLVLLKEEAKKAGIEMNLQRLDGSAMFKLILEKKHDVGWMGWSTPFRPRYWQGFHSENAHKAQTNNITNTDES